MKKISELKRKLQEWLPAINDVKTHYYYAIAAYDSWIEAGGWDDNWDGDRKLMDVVDASDWGQLNSIDNCAFCLKVEKSKSSIPNCSACIYNLLYINDYFNACTSTRSYPGVTYMRNEWDKLTVMARIKFLTHIEEWIRGEASDKYFKGVLTRENGGGDLRVNPLLWR